MKYLEVVDKHIYTRRLMLTVRTKQTECFELQYFLLLSLPATRTALKRETEFRAARASYLLAVSHIAG